LSCRNTLSIRPSSISTCRRGGVFIGALSAVPEPPLQGRPGSLKRMTEGNTWHSEPFPVLVPFRSRNFRQSDGPLAHQVIWTDVQGWLRSTASASPHFATSLRHKRLQHLPKHLHRPGESRLLHRKVGATLKRHMTGGSGDVPQEGQAC
jgi:hypothetical protein